MSNEDEGGANNLSFYESFELNAVHSQCRNFSAEISENGIDNGTN